MRFIGLTLQQTDLLSDELAMAQQKVIQKDNVSQAGRTFSAPFLIKAGHSSLETVCSESGSGAQGRNRTGDGGEARRQDTGNETKGGMC